MPKKIIPRLFSKSSPHFLKKMLHKLYKENTRYKSEPAKRKSAVIFLASKVFNKS